MNEFYNEAIKNRYLESIENEDSRYVIKYIFIASKVTEEILEKDLYNFSDEEVFLVMKNISPKSDNGARANINYLRAYISWAIKIGYRENNINPLDAVDRKIYSQFVDRNLKIHYSLDEFIDLIEEKDMLNGQDQAFLFCLWSGINGKQFSEIRDLKFEHINWDENKIYIVERDVTIEVSEQCIKYLDKAYKQDTYYTYNPETKEYNEKILLESNFVFKNVKSGRTEPHTKVSMAVLYNRLNMLKQIFNLEYLTGNSIRQSGMIYMAYESFVREGKLDKEQFYEIGYKYNVSMINDGEKDYPNVTLMKEFISSENLKELYDVDVNITFRQRNKK